MSDIIDIGQYLSTRNSSELTGPEKLLSSTSAEVLPFRVKNESDWLTSSDQYTALSLFSNALLALHFRNEFIASRDGQPASIIEGKINDFAMSVSKASIAQLGKLGLYVSVDMGSITTDHELFEPIKGAYRTFKAIYRPDDILTIEDYKVEYYRAEEFILKLSNLRMEIGELDTDDFEVFHSSDEINDASVAIFSKLSPASRAMLAASYIAYGNKIRHVIEGLARTSEYKTPYTFLNMSEGIITPSGITQIANMFEEIERTGAIEKENLSVIAHSIQAFCRDFLHHMEVSGSSGSLMETALDKCALRMGRIASRTRFDTDAIEITPEHISIYRKNYSIHPTLGEIDHREYFRALHRLDSDATERLIERVSNESQRLANQAIRESKFFAIKKEVTDAVIEALRDSRAHVEAGYDPDDKYKGIKIVQGDQSFSIGIEPLDPDDLSLDRVKVSSHSYSNRHLKVKDWTQNIFERFPTLTANDSWVVIAACHQWLNENHVGIDFKRVYDFTPTYQQPHEEHYEHASRAREWMKEAIAGGILPRDMKYTIANTYGGYDVKISALPEGMTLYRPHYEYMMNHELVDDWEKRRSFSANSSRYTYAYNALESAILLVLDATQRDTLNDGTYVFRDNDRTQCSVNVRATDQLKDQQSAICKDSVELGMIGTKKWESFDNFKLKPYQFNNEPAVIEELPFVELPAQKKKWTLDADMAIFIDHEYRKMAAEDDLRVLLPNLNQTPISAIDNLLRQRLPKGEAGKHVCEILENTKSMLMHASASRYAVLAFYGAAKHALAQYLPHEQVAKAQEAAKIGYFTVLHDNVGRSYSWRVNSSQNYSCPTTGKNYCTSLELVTHKQGQYPASPKLNEILARVDVHNGKNVFYEDTPQHKAYFSRIKIDDSLIALANARSLYGVSIKSNASIIEGFQDSIASEVRSSILAGNSGSVFPYKERTVEAIISNSLKFQVFQSMVANACDSGLINQLQAQTLLLYTGRKLEDEGIHHSILQSSSGAIFFAENKVIDSQGSLIERNDFEEHPIRTICDADTLVQTFIALKQSPLTEGQIKSVVDYHIKDNMVHKYVSLPKNALDGSIATKGYNCWYLHDPEGNKHTFSGGDAERLERMLAEHGTIQSYYHLDPTLTDAIRAQVRDEFLSLSNQAKFHSSLSQN